MHADEPRTPSRLSAAPRELTPPPGLEERLETSLREEGAFAPPSAAPRTGWLGAAAAVLLAVGFLAGRASSTPPGSGPSSPTHALLVRADERELSPAEHAERVREYGAWARGLASAGRLSGAERLEDRGWVVEEEGSRPLSGAPTSGYFLLNAADDEEALRLAASCPHVAHGGTLELRPVGRAE